MKVGTDGVLLGAWCRVAPEDGALLDIGTGTGVIALQLAQRTEAWQSRVEAVEIDERSCLRAGENFRRSEWAGRLGLHCMPVQDFARDATPRSFDHIVTNPPYFTESLLPPDAARAQARHTGMLSFGELLDCCAGLLKPNGRISMVLPAAEAGKMTAEALSMGFHASRRTEVWSTPKSGPKRILMEFSRSEAVAETSSLVIEDAGPGSFSEEYRALTRDFYLYF